MTREELDALRDNSKNDDQVVEILFDKIKDMESMTCNKCKHRSNSNMYCSVIRIRTGDIFGCNIFERN